MKTKTLMFLALSALLAMPTASIAHEASKPADKAEGAVIADAARPAVEAVERFATALRSGDLEAARGVLAEDVLILETGGAEYSREEYLGGHAIRDAAFLKDAHVQLLRRTAHAHGNLAWVGSESELHASRDGKPLTVLSTETMVLEKSGDDWHIVHIHWSSRPKQTESK